MQTLARRLAEIQPQLAQVLEAFAGCCADLAGRIAKPAFNQEIGSEKGGINASGDLQHGLDAYADKLFIEGLRKAPVAWLVSEEEEGAVALNPCDTRNAPYALAIDPLDGSSNIDTNASIGSILGVYQASNNPAASFAHKGEEQLAAAIAVYGPRTQLWLTTGQGAQLYLLDRDSGEFILANAQVQVPPETSEFAINASNYRHWPAPVRHYIETCLEGKEGERKRNFNMRWLASMVGEAARIFHRGGVFWYPADSRKGYTNGRLRLLYEAMPIAMLMEQAGGLCFNEQGRVLDQTAASLHQRTGLLFGSRNEAGYAQRQFQADAGRAQNLPLFGKHSLFHPDFSNPQER